ncbi:MAG: hypothetical protein NTW21_11795, partial [Verrucomicrobia bacterium]|nr:hypothetical protein [Verrucomicrobiota bacterium]
MKNLIENTRATLKHLALAAAVTVGLGAGSAQAAITRDAATSASLGGGNSSVAWPHTVGAGADRMLVVGVTTESNPDRTVASVTFGTQALTQVPGARAVNGATTANASDLWYLVAPAEVTDTITVTFSDVVGNGIVAGAVSLFGVVQGAPEAVANYSAGGGNTYSAAITTSTYGSWLVDAINNGTVGASFTPGSGQTTQWYNGGVNHAGACSTRQVEPAGATTDDWTTSGTSRRALSVAAFAPVTPPAPAADILTFSGPYGNAGVITGTDIALTVPYGTNVTAFAPTYTTSFGATCPAGFGSGEPQNFTSPVHYIVSSMAPVITKDYKVTVTVAAAPPGLPVMNGLVVWLKADAVDPTDTTQVRVAGSDVFVQQWNDSTSNGNNATQTDTALQPKYLIKNGRPVLRFPAVNDDTGAEMYLGDLSVQFPTAGSMFATATPGSGVTTDGRYNLFDNRNNDSRWVANTWNESQPGAFRGGRTNFETNPYGSWPQSGTHVYAMESSSSAYRFVIDGTQIGSTGGDYNSGSGQTWTIADRPGNGQQLNGDIPELILYNRVLSSEEANAVGRYLADKYGVTTTYVETSPQAKILSFGIAGSPAVINEDAKTLAWTVPYGTNLTTLAPTYALSSGATCDQPNSAVPSPDDFSGGPVHYIVKSSDNSITADYTVTVTVTPISSAKAILTFGLPGGMPAVIDEGAKTIAMNVPFGMNLATLAPAYTVSTFATGSPSSGTIVDFSATNQATYTISAQDGSNQPYLVTVTVLPEYPVTINMAYNNSMDGTASWEQKGTAATQVAPLAYTGTTWNNGGNGSAAVSNLKRSNGDTSDISVSKALRPVGAFGPGSFGSMGGNKLVSAAMGFGAWAAGDAAIMGQFQNILTFSGVEVSHSYDIAFALPGNGGRTAIYKYSQQTANAPCTDLPDWVNGQNYALLSTCIPNDSGQITIQMNCNGIDWSALSGWQLLDRGVRTTLNPEALIYAFSSLPGAGPVSMAGTDIAMVMPLGTDVSGLIPTFVMSGGATCTLATVGGSPIVSNTTPVDFASPVHFIVQSEDALTTTDYTVTVHLVAPSGKVYVNIDNANQTGLVGPAGGLGETWNQQLGGTASSASALLDSGGVVTSVGYSSSNLGGPDPWGNPNLKLLAVGLRNFDTGTGNSQQLVINNLTAGKPYDVWLASANMSDQRHNGVWSTTNVTDVPGDHPCGNTAGANGDTWVEANNYVLFSNTVAAGDGTITFNGHSISVAGFDCRLPLNGFQLVEVTSGPTSYNAWAALHAGDQTAEKDYNNDGVRNGIAYFMGENGLATNPGVVNGKVSWPQVGAVASFEVQVSADLTTWVPANPDDVDTTGTPGHVIYTFPKVDPKEF